MTGGRPSRNRGVGYFRLNPFQEPPFERGSRVRRAAARLAGSGLKTREALTTMQSHPCEHYLGSGQRNGAGRTVERNADAVRRHTLCHLARPSKSRHRPPFTLQVYTAVLKNSSTSPYRYQTRDRAATTLAKAERDSERG